MSLKYKNIIKLNTTSFGKERRENLTKEELRNSSPFPNPLVYEDYDEEFKRWVEEDLDISFENEKLPTFVLLSNQRFSEYMQTWQDVDNKKNMVLNFKAISRENNPQQGTIVGGTRNIPGNRTYLIKRVKAYDKNHRIYYIDYRMRQPFSIDLKYTVSIVTNKYELLNEFNILIQDKFKAIDCYIRPKGHFVAMKLENVSDESEYSIDNRQFYSQSFDITVMAYIITEDSFIVEEKPRLIFELSEDLEHKSYAQIEDYSECVEDNIYDSEYDYLPTILTVTFGPCSTECKFTVDADFKLEKNGLTLDNVKYYDVYKNGEKLEGIDENFTAERGDVMVFKNIGRLKMGYKSKIILRGYDPTSSYKKVDGTMYPEKEYEEVPED